MTRTARAIAALIALALLTAGCSSEKAVDLAGTVVDPPFTIASDTLTTEDGKPFTFAKDTTKPLTLVFFGYTNCPDICPTVLSSIASGLTKLSAKQRDEVQLFFVTSDPVRDTGPVLKSYLQRFDPSFSGLTGKIESIAKVGRSMGVFVDDGAKLPNGGYDPNSHTSYVIGIDETHKAPIFWGGDTAPIQFANDFKFLLTERPEHLKGGSSGG
ncbi:SCO family protein [Nocardioides marmoriginsengisoli]|uniref:SCO family protein n=1 Tax=Nocardioides marmoriginsengisoli TaxID=661483 RepID=UPI00160A2107|nr:SCO family protein [Nocardioides marmoriginsengisoli]